MYKKYTREEQEIARRGIRIEDFFICINYATKENRFAIDDDFKYAYDTKNPDLVFDLAKKWWYNNKPNASHKNGNIIDFLMYFEGFTFLEAMQILLTFHNSGDWETLMGIKRNTNAGADFKVSYGENGLPFN